METITEIVTPIKPKRIRNTSSAKQREYYLKWRESHLQQSLANSRHSSQIYMERKRKEKEMLQRANATIAKLCLEESS
jgi:hypothetical protein